MAQSLLEVLQTTQAKNLGNRVADGVIFVEAEQSIAVALQILTNSKILGAPVIDTSGKYNADNIPDAYCGFIDLLDITCFIADQIISSSYNTYSDSLNEEILVKTKAINAVNFSRCDKPQVVGKDANLIELVQGLLFASHRIPIVNHPTVIGSDTRKEKITSVVSQSDVVRFLWESKHLFAHQNPFSSPLKDIPLTKHEIIKVNQNTLLYNAILELKAHKVLAVAVVDDDNKLVAQFGVSSLRHVNPNTIEWVYSTISDFLKAANDKPVPTVRETQTLAEATQKLVVERYHRVWVVDEKHHPVGVVALFDVIQAVNTLTK